MNNNTKNLICTAYALVFLGLSAWCLHDAIYFALVASVWQAVLYALLGKRTFITFGASFVPAFLILAAFKAESPACGIAAAVCSAALIPACRRSRLDPRPKTELWVGTLILAEVLTFTILLASA